MSKAIRIICKQCMVNYRMPSSIIIKQSYPLPPYSTIIGMIHNACEYTEYHDMKISVQGTAHGKISDMYTRYSFTAGKKSEAGRHNLPIPTETENFHGAYRGVAYTELICNIKMVIHIQPQDEDFEKIITSLENPPKYLSLGRYEDLLDIEHIDEVSIDEIDSIITLHDIYIPENILINDEDNKDLPGTTYKLGKKYKIDSKTGIRIWENKENIRHICQGQEIYSIMSDGEYPVAFY